METEQKKWTSIVWICMRNSTLYSLVFFLLVLAMLYHLDYLHIPLDWPSLLQHGLLLLLMTVAAGVAFGYLEVNRIKTRLSQLQEAMLYMVKGNLSKPIPELGNDEIGMLAEQLERISKQWEEQVTSLQRLSTNNAQLAEKAKFSAVTEERQRLARELHDAVSQQLFAISMTATALGRTLEKNVQQAVRQVSLIEEMASVAQSEMRALLLHLRPVHLEGKRLSQGIAELLQELNAKVPMEIVFQMDQEVFLNKGVEDHLFRITQEALSNTLRHSKATRTEIKLSHGGHYFRLIIWDNGIGFDLDQQKSASYGLISMKERVHEIGGTLQIVTAPGKGTRIDIRVPIVQKEEEHVGDEAH